MKTIYGGLPHVEEDIRSTICYRMGGQRCGHISGECNQGERFPYDDSADKEIARLNELLKDE